MISLSENIKKFRIKNNITQEELAEKINVTRQAVSNWENGKTEPDIETLTKIAQIFDISIDELVDGIPKGITELRGKKSHLKLGIIFTTFYFISTLAFLVLQEPIHEYVSSTYDIFPSIIAAHIWKPFTIIFGGIGISFLVAYSSGFYVKNKNLRILFAVIGIILILLTTGYQIYIFMSYVIAYFNTYGPKLFLGTQYAVFIMSYSFIHALGPILLCFGIINNKK